MGLDISANVDDVIRDIDGVKRDLRDVFRRIRRMMAVVAEDARAYVRADADYTGQLRTAIGVETEDHAPGHRSIKVATDAMKAPYAAIVEFGSGMRSNKPSDGSVAAELPDLEERPPGYPYESPDIDYNEDNPFDLDGYGTFYGFAKHIEEWMRNKPINPMFGFTTSAILIAKTIIEKGQYAHPYLRPAWFQNELHVKRTARNAVRRAVR